MAVNPAARQLADLTRRYPRAQTSYSRGALTWKGQLRPSLLSDTYTVRVEWHPGSRPRVKVLYPPLERRGKARLPHVFKDDFLCLHLHEEWDDGRLITETIIPWASEWLLFYELWLATGEWLGGGHEPGA